MPRDTHTATRTSAPAIPLPATLPAIEKALMYLDAKGWRELGEALVTEATRQGCARTPPRRGSGSPERKRHGDARRGLGSAPERAGSRHRR